jgi:chlorophyllase
MAAPTEEMMKSSSSEVLEAANTSVFQPGKLAVEAIQVDHNVVPTPAIPVMIVAPKDAGTYPVTMLLHGFFLHNHFYEQLLRHVASHGHIMVAPQVSYHVHL